MTEFFPKTLTAAPPGTADLFAYLPPLFALYFLYWGGIVRLQDGGIGLAVHWRLPKVRSRDREPGRFSRLLGGLGFLLCWAVCLLMTLEMFRVLFSGRLDAMFSGILALAGSDRRPWAAGTCLLVFFFASCVLYGLAAFPVKLWVLATGREPSPERKRRMQREGGVWTMEKDGELRRVAGKNENFRQK